jgi:hypothetical protein
MSQFRSLSPYLVGLALVLTPAAGLAQPGRTFTPPPPPPPPPPYRPPPLPFSQTPAGSAAESMRLAAALHASQRAHDAIQRDHERIRSQARMLMESERMRRMTMSGQSSAPARAPTPAPAGVLVMTVDLDSQCGRLGLKKGDLLVSYAGKPLQSTKQVQDLIKDHQEAGEDLKLVILRAGERLSFDVRPGRLGVTMPTATPVARSVVRPWWR